MALGIFGGPAQERVPTPIGNRVDYARSRYPFICVTTRGHDEITTAGRIAGWRRLLEKGSRMVTPGGCLKFY
uniref:Uncharacterized protein n=1 Tax=Oryza glumipatula TaxID=40148 RepID=A0A0D9Y969_9ORYZ